MASVKLEDAKERNRLHPEFKIPKKLPRDFHGYCVKIMVPGERFWVRNVISEKNGILVGTIANDVFSVGKLKYGDKIKFNRKHIINIEKEDSNSKDFDEENNVLPISIYHGG